MLWSPSNLVLSLLVLLLIFHPSLGAQTLRPTPRVPVDLQIQLFAAEPDIVDPVALCFDESGKMYVVEMRDYALGIGPNRAPGGTIRVLEDRDGDGHADHSTVFAEGLSFPTSVTPWNGGVFVAAPPEIVYLKDTDGDGRADVRQVIYTGFKRGVTDSNLNGLRWGLDNRIHGLNGGNDGRIESAANPGAVIPLNGRDFSFDPVSADFRTTFQSSGGFGLVFDEWGRSFVTYNVNHMQQRVTAVPPLSKYPGAPSKGLTVSISDHEEMSRIYPISRPETRVNHPEQSGYFSSAGGMGWIGLPEWPADYTSSILVCDVVGNLVHRDIIRNDAVQSVASRSPREMSSEFITCEDPAFRPTGVEVGPDDALYLIDMQRDVIEHPDYIPEKTKAKLDLRAGSQRGRIYRISPKATHARGWFPPKTPAEWVANLGDPNPWRRGTAQRIIVGRQLRTLQGALQKMALGGRPLARLSALWTLEGLGLSTDRPILSALGAPEAGLRENAIQLAGLRLRSPPTLASHPSPKSSTNTALPGSSLIHALIALTNDASPRVRFTLAVNSSVLPHTEQLSVLLALLKRSAADKWIRWACLQYWPDAPTALLRSCEEQRLADFEGLRAELIEWVIAAGWENSKDAEFWSAWLRKQPRFALLEILTALGQGLRSSQSSREWPDRDAWLDRLFTSGDQSLRRTVWKVNHQLRRADGPEQLSAWKEASDQVKDTALPQSSRTVAATLVALGPPAEAAAILMPLLGEPNGEQWQTQILTALREIPRGPWVSGWVTAWPTLMPAHRPIVVNALLSEPHGREALVAALESGTIQVGELNLDLEQRRTLLHEATREIRQRASKFISDEEYANRKMAVDTLLAALPDEGVPTRGAPIFQRLCTPCHALNGQGHHVGPDLASVAHRSVEDILSNIVDPNMAINPAYITYRIETSDGESDLGLIGAQTGDNVTLIQPQEIRTTIARKKIKSIKATGQSLMPEGLETGLAPQDLRDLIAYIQSVH